MKPKFIRIAAAFLFLAFASSLVRAGEQAAPKFTRKPTAAKDGEKVKIEFEVDRETDVAVAIEDSAGKVIRHLAAGVLGDKAPKPLKAGSLAQSIEWDGRADGDKPAGDGPFKVRVSIGMQPLYDAKMFNEPQRFLGMNGLAAGGPNDELYTRGGGKDGGMGPRMDLRVYDREGKYARTIAPFPAGLGHERVKALGAFKVGENGYVPRVHAMRSYAFYPVSIKGPRTTQMAVSKEGHVFFMSGGTSNPHVCVLDKEGGVPEGWSFAGKGISTYDAKKGKDKNDPNLGPSGFLALSSDESKVYISGMNVIRSKKGAPSIPAVFRTDAKERGKAEVFCGSLTMEGGGDGELKDPQGVAADGKGHLLVADRGNGRVCVFSEKDGKFVTSFPVPAADKVQVDRKTGAVYVLTYTNKESLLLKFSNWKEHKELARMSLGGGGSGMAPFLAVSGGEQPVVWAGSNSYRRWTLQRIPDLGDKFGESKDISKGPGYLLEDVFVDRARNEVYVNLTPSYWRFKDGTEEAEEVKSPRGSGVGLTLRVGPKGNIYSHGYPKNFMRWDHSGKPLPFKKTGKNMIEIPTQMTFQLRGLHIDQLRDEIFLIHPNTQRKTPACFGSVVRVYDLEGNLKREAIHSVNFQSTVGPAVDAAGNIYIGEPSRPDSHELPPFFKGRLPDIKVEGKDRFLVLGETFPYSWGYGSVMKFSPKGGSVPWGKAKSHKLYKPFKEQVPGATNPTMYSQSSSARIKVAKSQGALWAHGGFFPLTSRIGCNCLASYFDVDYYGRSFYPDAGQSRVGILDTNGNQICHFGAYGNRDAVGEGEYIPLAMGLAVAATDKFIYVCDVANQCLIRVKLTYVAEEICAVQ